ncbi:MAG: histidine phosphatase family protein [Rhodobacteraceae bacterium]|nr:histidine phosphatase family protein [Paracoccaceae bacterium]
MIRLALLRHGHTPWNRAGRIQGRSDIALDDDARVGLAGFALPAPWNTAQLWSSPLSRAFETAQIVGGCAPQTAPELTEMNWGDWEGLRGLDLIEDPTVGFRHIEEWGWDYRAPNGESPREVWGRLQPWLDQLDTDCVAVCHIGVMRALLACAHGWDFNGPAPFDIKRNRLYILRLQQGNLCPEPEPLRLTRREGTA